MKLLTVLQYAGVSSIAGALELRVLHRTLTPTPLPQGGFLAQSERSSLGTQGLEPRESNQPKMIRGAVSSRPCTGKTSCTPRMQGTLPECTRLVPGTH